MTFCWFSRAFQINPMALETQRPSVALTIVDDVDETRRSKRASNEKKGHGRGRSRPFGRFNLYSCFFLMLDPQVTMAFKMV